MSPNRRDFIKNVGIAMASLVMTRCRGQGEGAATDTPKPELPTPTPTPESIPITCYEPIVPTPPPIPTPPDLPADARGRLRGCWGRLDWLAQQTQANEEIGQQARDQLMALHQEAVDEMVAAGELEAPVAEQVQLAFDEAAFHVWRVNVMMTCYEPTELGFAYERGRGELLKQAEILTEVAESVGLDANTVAQAQAAIEQDVALFQEGEALRALEWEKRLEAEHELAQQFEADAVAVGPETAEAARFLVELLLED